MEITKHPQTVIKHSIGEGKLVNAKKDITSVSIDLEEAMPTLHTVNGRPALTFYVARRKEPVNGSTHAVYFKDDLDGDFDV